MAFIVNNNDKLVQVINKVQALIDNDKQPYGRTHVWLSKADQVGSYTHYNDLELIPQYIKLFNIVAYHSQYATDGPNGQKATSKKVITLLESCLAFVQVQHDDEAAELFNEFI